MNIYEAKADLEYQECRSCILKETKDAHGECVQICHNYILRYKGNTVNREKYYCGYYFGNKKDIIYNEEDK